MFDTLIRFILTQRLLVVITAVVLVVAGTVAWTTLPIDAFPDVTNVQVMILSEAPGLASVDVEQRVTFPIEMAVQGLPDVLQIRSMSKSSLSQVIVVFEDDVDIYFARQLVFERIQGAREQLPEGVEPEMGPISTGLGEIYQYTVESDSRSPMELRTMQDWLIAPQLRSITGVNEVNSFGGFVKQYQVLIDPARLLKYRLTLQDVLEGLQNNNANAGGNFITQGWEQAYVRSVGMVENVQILKYCPASKDAQSVFVKDAAVWRLDRNTTGQTKDATGETVHVIMLRNHPKFVVESVKKAIPKIVTSLPKDVRIKPFYDLDTLIQACTRL